MVAFFWLKYMINEYFYSKYPIWIERIRQEYHEINTRYQLNLGKITFSIDKATHYFGRYCPRNNCIQIAEFLLTHHTYDEFIFILKHEMAHQVVYEKWGPMKSHGAEFQNMCQHMCLPRHFWKAEILLDDLLKFRKQDSALDAESTLSKKIEKLARLGQSSNEHEAALALQKVKELVDKHQLEFMHEKSRLQNTYLTLFFDLKRLSYKYYLLGKILNSFYHVEVVYSYYFDFQESTDKKSMVLIGQSHHLKISEYVFHFLMNMLEKLWKLYQFQNKITAQHRQSYETGLLDGFYEKLSDQNKGKLNDFPRNDLENSIIPAQLFEKEKKQRDDFVDQLFGQTKTTRSSFGGSGHSGAYHSGKARGKEISVNDAIGKSQKTLCLEVRI